MDEGYIGVGEFNRAFASIEKQMADGFNRTSNELGRVSRGLHKRLDQVDTTQDEHGEAIAVLKDRDQAADKRSRTSASTWGGSVGAIVILAIEGIKAATGWGK